MRMNEDRQQSPVLAPSKGSSDPNKQTKKEKKWFALPNHLGHTATTTTTTTPPWHAEAWFDCVSQKTGAVLDGGAPVGYFYFWVMNERRGRYLRGRSRMTAGDRCFRPRGAANRNERDVR